MDLFSINNIKDILFRHGFHFSKSLGQNFLTERSVCEQIAEGSEILPKDYVLEIGPGIGSLTSVLAKYAKKVVSVEIDRSLLPVLNETLAEFENVKIINEDILKCDLSSLVANEFKGDKPKICANLPYYITTPILSYLIKSGEFPSITTMIQKEVADRICAKAGTREYGAFTVFVQYYTQPKLLFTVDKECFIPQPKVQSAVVRLDTRQSPAVSPKSEELFFKVVRASFSQRRKQLVNSLQSAFKTEIEKSSIIEILSSLGHRSTVRGEELTIEEFCALSDAIYSEVLNTKS